MQDVLDVVERLPALMKGLALAAAGLLIGAGLRMLQNLSPLAVPAGGGGRLRGGGGAHPAVADPAGAGAACDVDGVAAAMSTVLLLFAIFAPLSLLAVGGLIPLLPEIQRQLVVEHGLLSARAFARGLRAGAGGAGAEHPVGRADGLAHRRALRVLLAALGRQCCRRRRCCALAGGGWLSRNAARPLVKAFRRGAGAAGARAVRGGWRAACRLGSGRGTGVGDGDGLFDRDLARLAASAGRARAWRGGGGAAVLSAPAHTRWAEVLALLALGVAGALQLGKVPPALLAIAGEFGVGLPWAAALLSFFALVAALAGLAAGLAAARLGVRRAPAGRGGGAGGGGLRRGGRALAAVAVRRARARGPRLSRP